MIEIEEGEQEEYELEEEQEEEEFDEDDDSDGAKLGRAWKEFTTHHENLAMLKESNKKNFRKLAIAGIILSLIIARGLYIQYFNLAENAVIPLLIFVGCVIVIIGLQPILQYLRKRAIIKKALKKTNLKLKNIGWRLAIKKMSREVDKQGNVKFSSDEVTFCPEDRENLVDKAKLDIKRSVKIAIKIITNIGNKKCH